MVLFSDSGQVVGHSRTEGETTCKQQVKHPTEGHRSERLVRCHGYGWSRNKQLGGRCLQTCERVAAFTKCEREVHDFVAENSVTNAKLCEAEELLCSSQNKYRTILGWNADNDLENEDDAKLPQRQKLLSEYGTRMIFFIAILSALSDKKKTD